MSNVTVLIIILLELFNGMGVRILPGLFKNKNNFCKQNHFTLAAQYEEVSLYQMQGRFLQIVRLTVVVVKQNIESGVLCCRSANPAEKPMCVLPIPMPSSPLRWQLEGARSSPLLFGILELCAPSSSPTPLPIISPISEQGIVFNLHTWNEKSVGNYIYHIP